MKIPGSNNLRMARRLIATQSFTLFRPSGTVLTDDGEPVTVLSKAETIRNASIQPVSQDRYLDLGLNLKKIFYQVWADIDLSSPLRTDAEAVIEYGGQRFRVCTDVPWFSTDGWSQFMIVRIGTASTDMTVPPIDKEPNIAR